jgi:ABC-type branched-subunit amino acid transport system ATPase component
MTPLLSVTGLTKRFGGFVALNAIDLAVVPGEEHVRQLPVRHANA